MQSALTLRHRIAAALLLVGTGCSGSTTATPEVPYDISSFAKILADQVNEDGLVDYASLVRDRSGLDHYVHQLASLGQDTYDGWTTDQQLAFWMNAYNALTLKAVVDHYPVDSIKDIGSVLNSVWDKLKFTVRHETLTLNDIEHNILRKKFSEPRIHMAINCASIGCPPLSNTPLQSDQLEKQFTRLTTQFLATPSKFSIDRGSATVHLSPIFKWFGDDFIAKYDRQPRTPGMGAKENAVLHFVAGYLPEADRTYLEAGAYSVKYLDYDWGLNKQ